MTLPPPPPSAGSGPSSSGTSVCYRHPDRPAGRRCTRCGRAACADCLVDAPVGSHCLECARADRPDARTRVKWAAAQQPTLVATVLIAINVATFVIELLQASGRNVMYRVGGSVIERFALAERYVADGDWYRLITSGFVHLGIIHIGFNMWMLYVLSQSLEPILGRVRFTLLYFASLLTGSLGVILLGGPLSAGAAGASGAIFGLLGAAVVGEWMQGINPAQSPIGQVVLFNLVFTFVVPNISIGGHLGGLIGGLVCGFVMLAPRHKNYPLWATYATPAAVAIIAFATSILTAQSL